MKIGFLNRHYLLIGILSILFACNKDSYLKNYPEIKGDYNWELSYFKDFTTVQKEDIDPKFGLRIKNNKHIEIYKNAELELSGEIIAIDKKSDGTIEFTVKFGQIAHSFAFSNNQLRSETYPFTAVYNIYLKE